MSSQTHADALKLFLEQHQLPESYLDSARRWFDPLANALAAARARATPLLVGVNGCQGSGKSTLCDYLALQLLLEHQLRAVSLSLDDVYLTRASREQLAKSVHPLLATRGVPGTHDIPLLLGTLERLRNLAPGETGSIPRFDKSSDDRKPEAAWESVTGPVDVIILEGWCLGVGAQPEEDLEKPLNKLEEWEDPDGSWRRYVNDAIRRDYEGVYRQIDQWVMLQAPSFDCVFEWRMEQERKLIESHGGERVMDSEGISRFIRFFQRLTEHGLRELPSNVDCLFQLDEHREVLHSSLSS